MTIIHRSLSAESPSSLGTTLHDVRKHIVSSGTTWRTGRSNMISAHQHALPDPRSPPQQVPTAIEPAPPHDGEGFAGRFPC